MISTCCFFSKPNPFISVTLMALPMAMSRRNPMSFSVLGCRFKPRIILSAGLIASSSASAAAAASAALGS
jgi:hypothetical protein